MIREIFTIFHIIVLEHVGENNKLRSPPIRLDLKGLLASKKAPF